MLYVDEFQADAFCLADAACKVDQNTNLFEKPDVILKQLLQRLLSLVTEHYSVYEVLPYIPFLCIRCIYYADRFMRRYKGGEGRRPISNRTKMSKIQTNKEVIMTKSSLCQEILFLTNQKWF